MRKIVIIMALFVLGASLHSQVTKKSEKGSVAPVPSAATTVKPMAAAKKDSLAQKAVTANKDTTIKRDALVKRDTLVKKDTTVKKDTAAGRSAPLVDSAKIKADSVRSLAVKNKQEEMKDCVEMDPTNPIIGRKFDQVNLVLGREIGLLMSRYLELNRKNKDLKGKLVIDFIIDKTGKVSQVRLKSNTLNNQEIENKAVAIIGRAVFPPATPLNVKSVIVHYPLYFFPW